MDITIKQQIAAGIANYMKEHTLTQTDVSVKTGVRKEYINTILKPDSNFTYNAGKAGIGLIPVRHFNKLADLIGFTTEKEYWETTPTAQMSGILATLTDAKQFGYTNVIIGQTGSGKSYIAELFAKKNPSDVFIIKVGSSDNISDLLDKCLDELRIPMAKTKSKKLRDIARKLRDMKNEGHLPMIIFDESEYMKQPALCASKELYDELYSFASIVLIGTDQLLNNIESLRKRNKPGIPQYYRRIKFGIRVLPTIDRKFDQFLADIEDKELVSFLQRNCENYGELHDVLVPCMREADRTGEPMSLSFVRKVLNISDQMYI